MKKKFHEDSFIEIDEWNTAKSSRHIVNNSEVALFTGSTYQDREYLTEIQRRQQFNSYYRLKHIRINTSMPTVLFSFSQGQFVVHNYKEDLWQVPLFGVTKPYIVKSLTMSPSYKHIDQLPELSNGYLGIAGFLDEVQMQSLYSGSFMETHRASIPSWTIRDITAVYDLNGNNIVEGRRMELDMSNGRLVQVLYSKSCIIEQQIYVHQTLKSLVVHEIQVQFFKSKLNVIVLKLPKDRKRDISSNIEINDISDNTKYIKIISGVTHVNDQKNHEQHIHGYYHSIPDEIRISKSDIITKYYYLMSVNENQETARQDFDKGMTLMEVDNRLFREHDNVWRNIWSTSGVFMKRANQLDVELISAQYLIISNLPSIGRESQYGAMGATGLGVKSNQGAGHSLMTNCGGRIEYSQELWIVHSQMLLHPNSVKSIIDKRISQLPMAKSNALHLNFKGAKYPTVANEQGEELCSKCKDVLFPTGVVALALGKYLLATGDQTMFTNEKAIGALMEINTFLMSVIDKYGRKNIESIPLSNLNMKVKNSLFDMALIRESLLMLPILIDFFKITPSNELAMYVLGLHNVSQSIELPFDNINNFHPPYNGFDLASGKLFFPEGLLLRYPLDHLVDVEASVRNLKIYEKRLVTPISPVTHSVLFINNMDADRISEAKDNFRNMIEFCDNNFKVWSNDSKIWKGSYIPAAAGYLDSVMFGLLGLRIRRSGLYMYPKLILDITSIEVSSLEYLGSKIRVIVNRLSGVSIQVVSSSDKASRLGVKDIEKKTSNVLSDVVTFPLNTHIVIRRLKLKSDVSL